MGYIDELGQLKLRTRNRLRSLMALETDEAIVRLNILRRHGSPVELATVDRVLWARSRDDDPLIPTLFPISPQTRENYIRLAPLSLNVQIGVVSLHVQSNLENVRGLIEAIAAINRLIVNRDCAGAAVAIDRAIRSFGYSHCLMRKAVLVRATAGEQQFQSVERLLADAGLQENNLITSSLVQCYQEKQDFLPMKRSVMSVPDRGALNQFRRDISRIPFHPHAKDEGALQEYLQSGLQSSLLDALIVAKFNAQLLPEGCCSHLRSVFDSLEAAAPSLDEIAQMYCPGDSESEQTFYKRSSAWLESSDVGRYRRLVDHFYDSPDASYFEITDELISSVDDWVRVENLDDLANSEVLTRHDSGHLRALENVGTVTRSALFNYCLHSTQGCTSVSEENLVRLMGRTQDLARTIQTTFTTNLAKSVGSDLSKLILYLLIAKRSRNERDDHLLRKVVQDLAVRRFDRNLTLLLKYLESRSSAIAVYAYEVFSEDFIARLYDLIRSTSEVSDARVALHHWMAEHTGDKVYLDRARTLLIDHQLNKVRNEIDDHRIYVDTARFQEWIGEELIRDLNSALSATEMGGQEFSANDSVVNFFVQRCYETFCSNKTFGISSYLGRRIRHGTFKGHLFSGVVGIEREPRFTRLLADAHIAEAWRDWRQDYEAKVDEIIRERLHVASTVKRDGLLRPSLVSAQKSEIIVACTKALVKDFGATKTTANAGLLLTEYCWRLAEVDLKAFNAHLKGRRQSLVNSDSLHHLRAMAPLALVSLAADFCRTLDRLINEKLMALQNWFKRPLSVAPKASLYLLYRAVVAEVREIFPTLPIPGEVAPDRDIELLGGAYHVLYDSFYVIVYNAAKHGKVGGVVEPRFSVVADSRNGGHSLLIQISSEIRDDDEEATVQQRLHVGTQGDVENAQTYEHRSGIPKLYQLQRADPSFSVQSVLCEGRRVNVALTYRLEH